MTQEKITMAEWKQKGDRLYVLEGPCGIEEAAACCTTPEGIKPMWRWQTTPAFAKPNYEGETGRALSLNAALRQAEKALATYRNRHPLPADATASLTTEDVCPR